MRRIKIYDNTNYQIAVEEILHVIRTTDPVEVTEKDAKGNYEIKTTTFKGNISKRLPSSLSLGEQYLIPDGVEYEIIYLKSSKDEKQICAYLQLTNPTSDSISCKIVGIRWPSGVYRDKSFEEIIHARPPIFE